MHRQNSVLILPRGFLVNDGGDIAALGILQLVYDTLDDSLVEVGQEQPHVVQVLVHPDTLI